MTGFSHRKLATVLIATPVVVIIGGILWRSWTAAEGIVHPARNEVDRTLAEFGVDFEEVSFETSDGLTLRGWYVPPSHPARAVVISQPGFAGHRPEVITHTAMLASDGYGVLSFDWRASGESDGDTATVGLHETYDVLAAREWLRSRPEIDQTRVGALGQSGGAAAIIRAAARDETIAAVVAETTFATLRDIMDTGIEQQTGLPAFPFARLVAFFGGIQAGASINDVRPVDDIGKIEPRPVLVIRGGRDQWVPAHNADLLMDAAGPSAELWHAPNAQHSQVLRDHPEEYERRVLEFFDAHLRGTAATEEAGHDPRGRPAGDASGRTT